MPRPIIQSRILKLTTKKEATNAPFSGKREPRTGIPRNPIFPNTIANSVILRSFASLSLRHATNAINAMIKCIANAIIRLIAASLRLSAE